MNGENYCWKMEETGVLFDTTSESSEAYSTESENEWVTVAKKKVNKKSKAMLENREPLDSFLVLVRVLDECYLGNPFIVSRKICNVLEESVESVRVTRSGLIFVYVCGAEEAVC